MLIDCIKIANKIWLENEKEIFALNKLNITPKFAIFQIGNNLASNKYINNKIKKADYLNIDYELIKIEKITEAELISLVNKFNRDKAYNGILIQLPLPNYINKEKIFNGIDNIKNIDGVFLNNRESFSIVPCTSLGIMKILEETVKNLQGKHVVIINRSEIVGKPLIPLLLSKNSTVTICHSKTKRIRSIISLADILIVGVGKVNFIKKNMVKKNCIVIDVGINFVGRKMCGDCSKNLYKYNKVTPVPGGVGQLTLAIFFSNLIKLTKIQNNLI